MSSTCQRRQRTAPGCAPKKRIRLSRTRWKKLRRLCAKHQGPERLRIKLILMLHEDACVSRVARRLDIDRKTVTKWRDRYLAEGLDGLYDRPRPGRPVEIDAVSRCQVIAVACSTPADLGVKFREAWTFDLLQEIVAKKQILNRFRPLSRSTIVSILADAKIRPHRIRMWLHSPDPAFRVKVTGICKLYLDPPKGATVLCVDEKTGMQALGRKHPVKPAGPRQDKRMDVEYVRNGTRNLLACFEPQTGKVFGQVCGTRTGEDLVAFMEEIAQRYPKGPIHIVWDNLNIHYDGKDERWTRFNKRHGNRFHFHYTPIHASWVNQIELFFGILHKRLLRHQVYNKVKELECAVLGFLVHWNTHECHPFQWTFKGYPMQ